jgi:hypothetical protein
LRLRRTVQSFFVCGPACIIGCDFATLPQVGPVAFLEEVQRVKYDSLDALVAYFLGIVATHKNSSAKLLKK